MFFRLQGQLLPQEKSDVSCSSGGNYAVLFQEIMGLSSGIRLLPRTVQATLHNLQRLLGSFSAS